MFFSTLALLACINAVGIANVASRQRSSAATRGLPLDGSNPNAGVPDEYLEDGLIKSWKAATKQDTDFLKMAIEKGLIHGFSTKTVMKEYTRFKRFTTKCLGDKISNLRRNWREQEDRRRDSKICCCCCCCFQSLFSTSLTLDLLALELSHSGSPQWRRPRPRGS